ncbi:uncharacterized protein G2W53_043845 [Senna tora]|uniref:Uncharacterized protein n=1 Tax=Senna tora TaxID=362788 RepID=A0A834SWC5_9FABA|nr:uncharacterized protein G2W53_043845 [Senna tora]
MAWLGRYKDRIGVGQTQRFDAF